MMRMWVVLLVLLPSRVWAAMGVEEARHLLGRTGFGAWGLDAVTALGGRYPTLDFLGV